MKLLFGRIVCETEHSILCRAKQFEFARRTVAHYPCAIAHFRWQRLNGGGDLLGNRGGRLGMESSRRRCQQQGSGGTTDAIAHQVLHVGGVGDDVWAMSGDEDRQVRMRLFATVPGIARFDSLRVPNSTVDMPSPTNAVTNDTLVRFARRVSHDLNNFSTVIRTYSELLLSELAPDSSAHADVHEIHRAAEDMVQYLQRVTRFARAANMKRVPVPVDTGLADAVAHFGTVVGGRSVETQLASGAIIQADAIWLRDIVVELLTNAHEAAPAGTPLRLSSVLRDGHVVMRVEDQGAGIPPELANTAVEPLVTGKTGVRGAGIGLSLIAAFVEAVGGTLSFATTNQGSTVELVLPATHG